MNTISIKDLHSKFKKLSPGEVILDIRTPEEYAEGHIPGSKNIPMDEIMNHLSELKGYQTIYMHCRSGGRVKSTYAALQPAGLNNIVCIIGEGFPDWEGNGFEVENG